MRRAPGVPGNGARSEMLRPDATENLSCLRVPARAQRGCRIGRVVDMVVDLRIALFVSRYYWIQIE